MKTLVLLLACLAAANASSYYAPPCYRVWNIQNYWVMPCQKVFTYKIHTCGSWFTTKYYSDVMKVYPLDCKEVSLDEFKSDCASKLNGRALTIYYAMSSHFYAWRNDLKRQVDAAKAAYLDAVTKYCNSYITYVYYCHRQEYINKKIAAVERYNAAIDEMYNNVVETYSAALSKTYQSVLNFHKQILDNAVKAFNLRLENIRKFEISLGERMSKYLYTFKSSMAKIIEKRADAYKALLYKVHCNNYWQSTNVNYVVNMFRNAQYDQCWQDASCYWSKLMAVKAKMIASYRCNYRIVTSTGMCGLARKEYQTFCRGLGNWSVFKTSRTIPCFKYIHYTFDYKPCQYKDLKTCDLNSVVQSVDDFKKAMEAKGRDAVSQARSVFAAWKMKWVGIHVDYYHRYVRLVEERHSFLCTYWRAQIYCNYHCFSVYHTNQFAAYKRALEARKDEAIRAYQNRLFQQISRACDTFVKQSNEYQKMVDTMVAKVVAGYKKALETRTTKIAEYTQKQYELRNKMRSALDTKLVKIFNLRCNQYYDMMMFYHPGQKLCGRPYDLWWSYKNKIYDDYCHQLHLFDAHWRDLIPRFVVHYSCGYKVKYGAKFAIPQLQCAFYNWEVHYPTTQCYNYQYNLWCNYHNYRLVHCASTGYYTYVL